MNKAVEDTDVYIQMIQNLLLLRLYGLVWTTNECRSRWRGGGGGCLDHVGDLRRVGLGQKLMSRLC